MVVIIGGTSGIGLETAKYLNSVGYKVLVCGRCNPSLDNIQFEYLDVTDSDTIEKMFSKIDTIDGLIYLAGTTMTKREISKFDKEDFYQIMDVNVTGFLLCLKYSYEVLKKNKAKIVVVNSLAARKASPISGVEYTTSKAALSGVVKQLALDFAKDEVLINSVFPSMTATPMLFKHTDKYTISQIKQAIPLQRIAQPLEIAKAIEFLVSDKNTYMTGCALDINGGLFLTS